MTKVTFMSDLHTEFWRDGINQFPFDEMDTDNDVLILAGDIGVGDSSLELLERLSAMFPDIVMVPGNHEYYQHDTRDCLSNLREMCAHIKNLHVLDREVVTINGTKIAGCTLWFPKTEVGERWQHQMMDFTAIKNFKPWVYEQAAANKEFIKQVHNNVDVIVTHHAPTYMSVAPTYAGSTLNLFFVHDVEELLRDSKLKLWVHGHMHGSIAYYVDGTKVMCNPYGYEPFDLNPMFNPGVRFIV